MADVPIPNPSAWLSILTKLGIPRFSQWRLLDTVQPVALVDSEITLNAAASTPLINVPNSAGEVAVPAANTRLATTGPLPAGPYSMVFWLSTNESVTGLSFRIRRRNAADTADIWSHRVFQGGPSGWPHVVLALRLNLALNEFVVVENPTVGNVGSIYQASIFVAAG